MAADPLFLKILKAKGLPAPIPEYPFSKPLGRKHRADYCWPAHMVILEVDGGVWSGGRHTRGAGWLNDTEKMWLAAQLGYRWVRCTPQQLRNPDTFEHLREVLAT